MKLTMVKLGLLAGSILLTPLTWAQVAQDPNAAPPPPVYSQQQLDQMLAPIALYPDALLSQVLEAATYPLEVVQAARWSRAHPELNGDAAVQAAKQNNWDASVISLTAFPQILQQMDDKLDWMQQLGDAFLAQQPQVMDTVQGLRQKASAAGNLQSNQQINVVTQPQTQTIVIQQASPQVIYVPYYNPSVVYGPWWWNDYPPVYWNPWPGYASVSSGFYFGSGIRISAGFFFSNVDWHRRSVNIVNVNNYYYRDRHYGGHNDGRPGQMGNRPGDNSGGPRAWQHDPDHRRGVGYPNPALQREFSRGHNPGDAQRAQRNQPRANQQRSAQPQINQPNAQHNGNQAARPSGGYGGDNGNRSQNPARIESQPRPANAVRQERPDNLQGFNNRIDSNQPRNNAQQERSIQMPNTQPRPAPAMREPSRQESPRPQAEPRGGGGNAGGERRER